jgi:lipopolysaccharide/colanic/teichoic acid biosynthesis glycosyltransferase
MLLIALLVRIDSAGPVFFSQERSGMAGRPFKLLKFRTMLAAVQQESEWEEDNIHRITRVGWWLRKCRLDELPQFINILKGDMNIVGPRPHPSSNFELFVLAARNTPESGVQIPYYSMRYSVRPGITGWAQVRYRYANNLHEEMEKLRFDLYYLKHYSLWLDIRILVETVTMIFTGSHQVQDQAPDQLLVADTVTDLSGRAEKIPAAADQPPQMDVRSRDVA